MSDGHYHKLRRGSIRERLRFLAQDSALYGLAASLSRTLNLLILPVLTRLFSNAEYGALDAITVLGAVFVAFIIMGQDSAIARFYYESEDDDDRRQIISQALVIELVLLAAVTIGVWLGAERLLGGIYGIPQYVDEFRILVASFPFAVLVRFCSNLLRWTFARYQFVFISFGSSLAIVALTLGLVLGLDAGMKGVFLAQLIGNALFAVIGLALCRRHFVWPRGFEFGSGMLRFGIPYMVVGVAMCVIPAIDRVFVTRFLGLDATGVYAIGYRYAFLLMLPSQAFMSAWVPFAFAIYKEPTAPETYDRVLTFFVAAMGLLVIAMVSVAEPLIELVASARYLGGAVVVLPLLLGLAIQSASFVSGIGIDLSKQTHFSMISYFIGIAAGAPAIWLLIEPLELLGVGIGVLVGRVAQASAYTAFAFFVYPLRMRWRRPLAMLVVVGVAGAAMQAVTMPSLAATIGYRATCVAVVAALTWFVMLNGPERVRAREAIAGYLGGERA